MWISKKPIKTCSPLKISQSINAESTCDGNNKSMYSCFYGSKKFLDVLRGKKQKIVKMYFFKALAKMFLFIWKSCSWPTFYQMDFLMIFSIYYITKSRLDVQFVKKIPLGMVIGQQMEEEGYDQNNVFTSNFPFICYLSRICY